MVDPAHPHAALTGACTFANLTLPEPLPGEPFGLLAQWLALAAQQKVQPNPNAMALATVDAHGQPSNRIVLCRRLDPARGYLVFFTNYQSHKGQDMAANPKVAACFHWDDLDRQARIQGVVTRSPAAESDEYFNSRPVLSRVAAWASDQSRPIASRQELIDKDAQARRRYGLGPGEQAGEGAAASVPRPQHWGGFRLWATRVELWLGHTNRLHDRAVWERELSPETIDGVPGYVGGPWRVTRLQP